MFPRYPVGVPFVESLGTMLNSHPKETWAILWKVQLEQKNNSMKFNKNHWHHLALNYVDLVPLARKITASDVSKPAPLDCRRVFTTPHRCHQETPLAPARYIFASRPVTDRMGI